MWISEQMRGTKQPEPELAVVTGLAEGMTLSAGGEITGAPVVNTMRDPDIGDRVAVLPRGNGYLCLGVVEEWNGNADLILQRGEAIIKLRPDGDVEIGGVVIRRDGRIEAKGFTENGG